ncbi:MAG: tRNA pseudouridine(55) synthase TruB [Armatimonadota bacterium]|nr:tRNA pseudouridine(55) synthase TruB [Armatimonadota bacterium]MDR7421730.1 tRNA pseudouridine(55) synthase TruB [Armatimonadota bacterium]MDR7453717.1 tRNA pseudouridine(55) synthase TruB [Armatimonadota bacterium]MDR7456408.1 tRNA pseudouridine(55) synthase TruB [Armatimonadota bacterium]MDR7497804.1 tRNA pseudouridine(55) synthase TruB [Armatimonadota bacterium]
MSNRPRSDPRPVFSGVLNVLKPPGMTSHDVVDEARRWAGMRRIGHTGTLDPGAAGVLVLCLGDATRIAEFLTDQRKAYRAEFTFGASTDSGDAYGTLIGEHDASVLTAADVQAALAGFLGVQEQVPPMVSAVHRGGRRLYEHARRGETVEVEPRRIEITECRLLRFQPGPRARALVHVECSKGTYIRALARDLGERLAVGAHASFVLRTRAGRFEIAEAMTFEELAEVAAEGRLPAVLTSMDDALADLPVVDLTPGQRVQISDGRPLPLFQIPGWARLPTDRPIRLRDSRGLLALGRIEEGRIRPFRVLRGASGS